MAARRSYWKVVGVIFTSVVAPLAVKYLDVSGSEPATPEPVPAVVPAEPPVELSANTTRVVGKGTGATPEAAFQSAVDAALQQSVASEVSAADWGRNGPQYLASLRRNGGGVLRGWRELSSVGERHLTGKVYRSEVAVDVDAAALRERLRPAGRLTPPTPPVATTHASQPARYGPVVLAVSTAAGN